MVKKTKQLKYLIYNQMYINLLVVKQLPFNVFNISGLGRAKLIKL
jgi:hypothetical protein